MRNIFKISFLSGVFATLLITGSGCLKDELADNGETNPDIPSSPSVIEIPGPVRATTSYKTSYAVSLVGSDRDTTFDMVFVRLAADQPAPEDIQVELELVPSLLTAYNDSTGTHLTQPAANLYSFPSGLTVTIPKGAREGSLQVKTKPNALVGPEYGFGVRIKSVPNTKYLVSGNYNNAVIIIGVRNKYDADYTLKIKHTGWAAYGIADGVTYTYPENIAMITASANSVTLFSYYTQNILQPGFDATGGATQFGAAAPMFTFDVATDKLTNVSNTLPDDGRGRAFTMNPNVTTSRFDPATKTIYAAYIMKQNGRPDFLIYDTLSFVGARP